MLKLFYSTSSAGGFFSPLAHNEKSGEKAAFFMGLHGTDMVYTERKVITRNKGSLHGINGITWNINFLTQKRGIK